MHKRHEKEILMRKKVKTLVFEFIEGRGFSIFIMTLIFLNVFAVVIETVGDISAQFDSFLFAFELFSVVVFTIEYIIRLWVCTVDERYRGSVIGRIKYALSPLAVIDLLAILPFYLPMLLTLDLRFIRAVRLVRLFRIFKMGRYSRSLKILGKVLVNKREELLITIFVVMILLVMASSLMYFFENDAQPDAFSNIPASMWWGVATLTTVGYGDIYPITLAGKFLGTIISILGIGMFALPAGILGSGFIEEWQKRTGKPALCPHCGKQIQ